MNISRKDKDLEALENRFDFEFMISIVFTVVRLITLIFGIIVHRAFYKLRKRLPGRSINQIIYPYMVIHYWSVFSCWLNGPPPLGIKLSFHMFVRLSFCCRFNLELFSVDEDFNMIHTCSKNEPFLLQRLQESWLQSSTKVVKRFIFPAPLFRFWPLLKKKFL